MSEDRLRRAARGILPPGLVVRIYEIGGLFLCVLIDVRVLRPRPRVVHLPVHPGHQFGREPEIVSASVSGVRPLTVPALKEKIPALLQARRITPTRSSSCQH
jgi:hypothetical protein